MRPGVPQVLLLYGWVDYADSSSNLAASQAGVGAQPPVLEIADGDGFRVATERMGFPAGLPKTMVVPLRDIAVESGRPLRIRTNMRIYWDRIELAEVADIPVQEWRLDAQTAEFGFAGYPEPHRPRGIRPPSTATERARRGTSGAPTRGNTPRHGDVLPLLDEIDDRYVIARHGDELRLRFDARQVPPPAPGTGRSFFAFADGFGKDMDLNSARPHTIERCRSTGCRAIRIPRTPIRTPRSWRAGAPSTTPGGSARRGGTGSWRTANRPPKRPARPAPRSGVNREPRR